MLVPLLKQLLPMMWCDVVVIVHSFFLSYPRKHRPFEALTAVLVLHPTASASWSCIVTATVTITTPNNASADTMAITANVVLLFIAKLKPNSFSLKVSTINHRLLDNFCRLWRIMVLKIGFSLTLWASATNSSTNTIFQHPNVTPLKPTKRRKESKRPAWKH